MEVPRLRVESELQLLPHPWQLGIRAQSATYTRLTAMLSEARNQTRVLMDTSWIHYCCATMGTPSPGDFKVNWTHFMIFVPQELRQGVRNGTGLAFGPYVSQAREESGPTCSQAGPF